MIPPAPTHDPLKFAHWMPIARGYLGLPERLGDGLNPEISTFFSCTRFPRDQITIDTSWCSAFACTVMQRAGLPHPHSAAARHWIPWGRALLLPVYGAVLIFARGVDQTRGHVGFSAQLLFHPDAREVSCLAGNQRNKVCIASHPMHTLLGVRWPVGVPLPPDAVEVDR